MSEIRVKVHPTLGILICTDGRICHPAHNGKKAKWTFGTKTTRGYRSVGVCNQKNLLVHRLVAETFIPNPDNKPFIDHINRDRSDNRVENLRWVNAKTNQRNTKANDRCIEHVGVHTYEDIHEYNKRNCKQWYEANKERISALKKTPEYREQENAASRERYKKNRDEILRKQREYRHKNNPSMKWSAKYGYSC